MTKINSLSFGKPSFLITALILFFSLQIKAQDSAYLQKAIQSCLEHRQVQPHLKAVSFENNKDVLVVQSNSLTPSGLSLYMFGKEASVLDKPTIFFFEIEDYVALTDVQTKKNNITVTFTAGASVTCKYSIKQEKVKSLDKILSD